MARVTDPEFDHDLVEAALHRRFFQMNLLQYSAGIRNLRAYFDALVHIGRIEPTDIDEAYGGIEWRNRWSRRIGLLITVGATGVLIFAFQAYGPWRVLGLAGAALAGWGLYRSWRPSTNPSPRPSRQAPAGDGSAPADSSGH